MATVLQIRNLALGYPDVMLFRQLSMDIEAGATLAVLGANGQVAETSSLIRGRPNRAPVRLRHNNPGTH